MSVLDRLQFYFMHFMPYPHVAAGPSQSHWVDIPNSSFDPSEGNRLYRQYLDQMVLGDDARIRRPRGE